jgi:hypothetical protein
MRAFRLIGSSRKNRRIPNPWRMAWRARATQKTVSDGQKTCNITWGYVASSAGGQVGGDGFKAIGAPTPRPAPRKILALVGKRPERSEGNR